MEKQFVIIAILIIQKFIISVPYMLSAVSHIDPNRKVFPQISAKPQISAALLTLRSE